MTDKKILVEKLIDKKLTAYPYVAVGSQFSITQDEFDIWEKVGIVRKVSKRKSQSKPKLINESKED